MRKLSILLLLVTLSIALNAQIAGINLSSAITMGNSGEINYEQLYKLKSGYIIPFQHTPVGLKHWAEKFSEIMALNDLNYENAIVKEVLLASYVDGLTDYGNLSTSLKAGSSEVIFAWRVSDYNISFSLDSEAVAIFISKKE